MPPRKSQSPSLAAAGNASGGTANANANIVAGGGSNSSGKEDGGKRKHAKLDLTPLTNEERNFLAGVISLAGSSSPAAPAAATPTPAKPKPNTATTSGGSNANSSNHSHIAANGISSAGKQLLDDAWWVETAMPKFAAIAEKVLKMAAEQYHANHKDYVPPTGGGAGGAVGVGRTGSNGAGGTKPGDMPSVSMNNASVTVVPSGAAAQAAAAHAPPPPPAGSPAQFAEENAYLVDQLKQLPQCPFTVERLAEILSDPYMYHTTKDGKLKPEALQASLRRCILVTYPVIVSVSTSSGNEEG